MNPPAPGSVNEFEPDPTRATTAVSS